MNNISPAISVIIPMYNAERYIGFCLYSILEQVFADYELILIDDGSIDSTYEVCREILSDESAVTLLRNQENQGQFYCRNKGMDIARGKYVYFMDSDDELLPEALGTLYKIAEAEQADVVHTNYYFISYAEGRMLFRQSLWIPNTGLNIEAGIMGRTIDERISTYATNQPMPWLNLYRKAFLTEKKIKFRKLRLHEDVVFNLEVCLKASKYVLVNEMLNIYRKYYDEEKRIEKNLSQVFVNMARVLNAFDDIFSQFTYEKISVAKRMDICNGWLGLALQAWIFDVVDTRETADFFRFTDTLKSSAVQGNFIKYFLPLLVRQIDLDTDFRARMREQQEKQLSGYAKNFQEVENGEHKGDYAYIYCLAKRATLLKNKCGIDSFYEYRWLARAAFQLGRYQESDEAYARTLNYIDEDLQEKEKILWEKNFISPYLNHGVSLGSMTMLENVSENGTCGDVVLGVCAHYYSLTDDMLSCWHKIMQQLPKAHMVIAAAEFEAKAMVIEAVERLLFHGFDSGRVQFKTHDEAFFQQIDILLDTYPVSQGSVVRNALSRGIPAISLGGQIQESLAGAVLLKSIGLDELAAKSVDEYAVKTIALASDSELLGILKMKLPDMMRR